MLKSILSLTLMSFMSLALVSCNKESSQAKPDPELRAIASQVDAVYDSINKGDLLSASAERDRQGIMEALIEIKIELLRLSDSPEPNREFRRLKTLLKELEKYNVLKEDRAVLEQLSVKVYATVEKIARSKGVSLEDFEWTLYSTRFSTGIAPFATYSNGVNWEPGWSLDESWVRVSGQDVKAWLLGPSCDLRGIRNPTFTIDHTLLINRNTGRFATDEFSRPLIMSTVFKAMVSTDYTDGDPSKATWKRVDLGPMPNADDFHTVTSQNVDLSSFANSENVTVAFFYDMDTKILGHHYVTWQLYNYALQGAGVLPPCQTRSRVLMEKLFDKLEPYQQFNAGDVSGLWSQFSISGKNYAKIGSNGESLHSWLLSPKYKLRNQKYLKLVIAETVRNPDWANFRIKISSDYSGGDPALATWTDIKHEPAKPVDIDTWKDIVTEPYDLSAFAGKDIVVAFEFLNEKVTTPVIWEIQSVRIVGQGDDITVETYPIVKPVEETK